MAGWLANATFGTPHISGSKKGRSRSRTLSRQWIEDRGQSRAKRMDGERILGRTEKGKESESEKGE